MSNFSSQRVVYLLGAGASQACLDLVKSDYGMLMWHLGPGMRSGLRELVEGERYGGSDALRGLVNDVVDEDTDYEHLITFLDQSPADLHRRFAADMRGLFEDVLRERLKEVEDEQGETPDELYFGLLDLHSVEGLPEVLQGFLTLNYDDYLEHAIERSPLHSLDPGIDVGPQAETGQPVPVLKLHGSFGWTGGWPISRGGDGAVWIPPGIQKSKERYPFNLLWGLARELLDCDVLRIIGCKLGANDWDLVSLLFTTRHATEQSEPYRVEVIDAPEQAQRLQAQFPYLDVKSILEIESIGTNLIAEYGGEAGRSFEELSDEDQEAVIVRAGSDDNWFWIWLKHKAEALSEDVDTLSTELGSIERLLGAY